VNTETKEVTPSIPRNVQPRLIPGDVDSLVISQANALATSIQDMSLLERRILMLALAVLSRSDVGLPFVRIYSSDVRRAFGLSHNSLNADLDDASKKLISRYVEFLRGRHGSNSRVSWVQEIHFTSGKDSEVGTAYLDVQLHERMSQYVLQLTGNFFRVPFAVLAKFRSIYSMRLCEMLTAESHGGRKREVYFDLPELKKILDCNTKSYRNFSNFRQRVLEPAQSDNEDVGFMEFEYETVKRGRKVIGLKFHVSFDNERDDPDDLDVSFDDEDIRRMTLENDMRESGFSYSAKPYIERLGLEEVERIYRECKRVRTDLQGTGKEIQNFGGFFHTQLKQAMDQPRVIGQTIDSDGFEHLESQQIFDIADAINVEVYRGRLEHAMTTYMSLPAAEREEVRRKALVLDMWVEQRIAKEGEEGDAFRGAVKRVLESRGFQYSADVPGVRDVAERMGIDRYPPATREKILQAARHND
jgi:plasmid replication initiation protein